MQWRVRDGKGAKGRVLPLSERLPQELLNYWRAQRQGKAGHNSPWLFLGKKAGQPMSTYAGQNIYYSALKKSGVRYKGGIHTLRHSALAACCLWYTGIGRQSFPLSTLPASTLGASLLRQPALSALPGRQKLAMARQADTESLTDHLLPLRLHSTGGTQFSDASQPAQTLPALVRLRRTESAGVRTQPTRWKSRNHRCLTYLGTEARLPSPSPLHCYRRSIKSGWQTVALAQTAKVPLSRASGCRAVPRQVPGRTRSDA